MDEQQREDGPAADLVVHVQDAMLPKSLPVPQGAVVAARYLLADDLSVAGGDWFDAMVLDDGRVVVCVGDVAGAGPEAAVVMGRLRTVFDDRVRESGDLDTSLQALDRRTRWEPEGRGTTVCATALDPRTGELTYCTAGHPPPVVVDAAGRASYLLATGSPSLGAASGRFATAVHQLEPGDVVLLYSDGLVDRPGRSPEHSAAELLQVVVETVTARDADDLGHTVDDDADEPLVDRLCGDTLDVLTGVSGYRDDVAVLALQRVASVPPLHLVLPALPEAPRAARVSVGDWLAPLHVTALDDLSVRHSVSELVANAVEHAYDGPGVHDQVRVAVRLGADGVLDLEVVDDGSWLERSTSSEGRGRGLAIVAGLVDELRLVRGAEGTRATVRHRLRRPAAMLRGLVGGRPGVRRLPDFRLHVDGCRVRASGDVGGAAAEELQRTLDRCSQGGTRAVDVDLSEVSLLGSAGVQVLVDARAAGDVRLIAPVGSAAQHVLEIVRVPYQS